jgi:rhamnosyltransferase subunit B
MDVAKDADFIIAGEIVYAARLVAETLGIRWASTALQPFSFFSAYDPPVFSFFRCWRNSVHWVSPSIGV